jgi:hypothetical protein
MNEIIFNNIRFFATHEVHKNPMFYNDRYFKIWYDKSKKKITFEIKYDFDINLGLKMGCWECISNRLDNYGYPGFKLDGRMIKIHRFMYCVFNNIQDIDEINKKIIRHKCDNRLCSNPNHLEIGTHKQNMEDMRNSGSLKGEKNPCSKLTELDILYIRNSEMGLSYLSEMYGVNRNTIRRIKKRQLWGHVEDPENIEINI